jgi:hypothetical protein
MPGSAPDGWRQSNKHMQNENLKVVPGAQRNWLDATRMIKIIHDRFTP